MDVLTICTHAHALAITSYDRRHAAKGQKQERLSKVLKETYAVDSESHIRYQGGCVPDPNKFCSRLDFHVIGKNTELTLHTLDTC